MFVFEGVKARHVGIAAEGVADEDDIITFSGKFAVALVGDLEFQERDAALRDKTARG
jgi:hypothetical protein